jgi:NADPH:quinone reductase-like Zn-dependent oxidoreductase
VPLGDRTPDPEMIRELWRVGRTGSFDHLHLDRDALPPPGPGEARVSVRAVGLNLADVFACLGLYSATPPTPFTPGLEVAGVVEAAGPPASPGGPSGPRWRPGDRVIALTRFGGYATALNADGRYLRPLPAHWSFTEGAAFAVQALTAWYALHSLARVQPRDVVLVHSGAGGVGLNALALIDACSATAVATVGSEAKRGLLAERARLTPERIIVRDRRRFADQLDCALGALGAPGFDIVLDAVAGPFFLPAFKRLQPEGRMVIFGASDMMPAGRRTSRLRLLPRYLRRPRLDPMRMMSSNRSVMAFNLIWLWDRVDRLTALYEPMAGVLRTPPLVGRAFPFCEAPAALRWMKTGDSVGKIVLEVA